MLARAGGGVVGFLARRPVRQPARNIVGERVNDGAIGEEGKAQDRLPRGRGADAAEAAGAGACVRSRRVPDTPEQCPVALDALPDALDALGLAGLEVVDGVDDRAGEAQHIDCPSDPTLPRAAPQQLVAIELLDGPDDGGWASMRSTWTTWASMAYWMAVVSPSTALGGILPVDGEVGGRRRLDRTRRALVPRNDLRASKVRPSGRRTSTSGTALFVVERDASGAGLDALHPRLGVRRPFRVDRHHMTAVECKVAGGEALHVSIHLVGVVLSTVYGNGTGRPEKAGQEGIRKRAAVAR